MAEPSATPTANVPACRQPEFFLRRLRRLVALDRDPDLTDQERRLVRKAIYSTYLDCRALGVGEEARALLSAASSRPGD